MKIRILDTEYDVTDAVNRASLNDLMELKVKTRKDGYSGVSALTIKTTFETLSERAKTGDLEGVDLFDDPEFIINMVGVMWLTRRRAGEKLSVEEAGNVSFQDFGFVPDEEPSKEEEEDPVPFSGAVDAAPPTTVTSTTSTT